MKPTLRQKFHYWFDNLMGRGLGALIAVLAVAVLVILLITTTVVLLLNVGPAADGAGPIEVFWLNMIRVLSAADVTHGSGWIFRVVMLLVTIAGVFLVASLVGIVARSFNAKVEDLRKGRSRVLESGHTVIYGWNANTALIVSEICEANRSQRSAAVVIMAPRDKVEMEDELRKAIPHPGRTKIICRSGDPLDQGDLTLVSPFAAKSIVILNTDTGEDADSRSIKTVLGLTRHPDRPEGHPLNIVARIRKPVSIEAAHLAGGDSVTWIRGNQKVGQIAAQTSRQPGLSVVYQELLAFEGVEIYFSDQPSLYGQTIGQAQMSFLDSAVIGILKDGQVELNPLPGTVYADGDSLVMVAEDQDSIKTAPPGVPDATAISSSSEAARKPERTLVLGANLSLPHMILELDRYMAKGSEVLVVSEFPVEQLADPVNATVTLREAATSDRAVLNSLDVTSYDRVIVNAYRNHLSIADADTKTLITLLHLRDIMSNAGVRINVVSEMLDERNRKLVEVADIDDFIISDRLVGLMVAQVSQNHQLHDVFSELFSTEGAEIYLNPAHWYLKPGAEADFYTVVAAAQARGETAIGYVLAASDGRPAVVNVSPVKSELLTFSSTDRIAVLASTPL